jgi:hypothetical protein
MNSSDDSQYIGHFDGVPGLVWYAKVTPTRGDQLKIGDWLDSLDHQGARTIQGIRVGEPGSSCRQVHFGGGYEVYSDGSSDSEVIRDDVMYDVVDPKSQVDPFGEPVDQVTGGTRG